MTTNTDELWRHALKLAEAASDEASLRTAISRVYYSAFHLLSARLGSRFRFDPNAGTGTHKQLIQFLQQNARSIPQGFALGRKMESIFELRINADYRLHKELTRADLDCALRTVRLIRDTLGESKDELESPGFPEPSI